MNKSGCDTSFYTYFNMDVALNSLRPIAEQFGFIISDKLLVNNYMQQGIGLMNSNDPDNSRGILFTDLFHLEYFLQGFARAKGYQMYISEGEWKIQDIEEFNTVSKEQE